MTITEGPAETLSIDLRPLTEPIAKRSFLRQSLLFAELARLSYYRPEIVDLVADQIGLEYCQFFERDGAQAYLLANQHDCIVVCRGTEPNEWNDIAADANAVAVVAETVGKVHCGFKNEVDDLWPRLQIALKENQKPLWFTGHSLGGAMATICAGRCKLAEIPSNPEGLFTYGSPRVGNARYINFVKIPHFRFVHNNDIVCRVPPAWLGYRHCGSEIYFDARGKMRNYRSWKRMYDRLLGFALSLRRFRIDHFSDHSMLEYIQSIRNALEEESAGRLALPAKFTRYQQSR